MPQRWVECWNSLRFALGLRRKQAELDEEVSFHLEEAIDELVQQGRRREDARRAVLREFGGLENFKEECRDAWGVRMATALARDLRFSARSLRKTPGFTLTVVVTLALCIGGNTAMFSVLYDLVLKPLPFANADRIIQIFKVYKPNPSKDSQVGWLQYRDFKRQADLFEGFALVSPITKVSNDAPLNGLRVTSDFFGLMGVQPLLGRFFTAQEVDPSPVQEAGLARIVWDTDFAVDPLPVEVVVLTQTEWENEYGSNPNVIGTKIDFLNQAPATIVGVAPRSMEAFDSQVRFFMPRRVGGGIANTYLWARLKPGVSRSQTAEQLMGIERRWYEDVANAATRARVDLDQLSFEIGRRNPMETPLLLLQAGTLLVLLAGCINVINLLLGRASRRRHEFSIRRSLGAGGLGLARLMASESLLLAAAGAVTGSLLAWSALKTVNRFMATLSPGAAPAQLEGAVLAWSATVTVLVALAMGVTPFALLWKSGRVQRVERSAKGASAGSGARLLSSALVVSQVAITFALMTGAGLLFRSFNNVLAVDPGFDASRVVTGRVYLANLYDSSEYDGARHRIIEAMRTIPGVERVSFEGNNNMVGGYLQTAPISIPADASGGEEAKAALVKHVDSEYFATMGIPILEGRSFSPGEEVASYIVDQAFAERYLSGREAVGTEIKWGSRSLPVAGVAARANFEGLDARDGLPVVYVARDRTPWERFTLVVRTSRSPDSLIGDMQSKLREINPGLRLFGPNSLDVPYDNLNLGRRGTTLLVVAFAGLALLLSSIGIYGVLSYDVQQRRKEIGIRSAIGADRGQVLSLVLRQGLGKASLGLIVGLIGSVCLNRFLESRLFDVTALDPLTYTVGLAALLVVALVASYLPARRALRIHPVESLRAD